MTASSTAVNVLGGLSDDEINTFVASCVLTEHQSGESIFSEGDGGDDLFIVKTGKVRISKAISLDVDRTLTVLGEGGVFGELAIVGQGSRSASAVAVEHTTVLALSKASFVKLTEDAPALGLKIMGRFAAMLADRLRVTTDLLRDTVQWGLEVSGAAGLDLHRLSQAQSRLSMTLVNGDRIAGRLLKAEKNDAGILLTMSGTDDQLHLVPYHSVVAIRVGKAILEAGDE
jgi:CRP/FNR family transcriptional regulator, cyclic AMP receptor protein